MHRFLAVLMLFLGLSSLTPSDAFARYASIVVNETTGNVMYSRNADAKLFPASLTKVMTLYLLFEALDSGQVTLDTKMKVSRVAAGRSPSKLGLRAGSHLKVRDALLSLVTKSANDAATVIAEHLASTEREFAKKMTRKAHALGMPNTTFKNASGLPHSQQKSTARDMARLAIAIRKDFPQYFHYFNTRHFSYKGKKYGNHNRLLSAYAGTDGIKTGYIKASGFNLIATVKRNGTRLVGVVFGGRTGASRNAHMIKLLDKQFARVPRFTVPKTQQVKHRFLPVPKRRPTTALAALQAPPPRPIIETDLPTLDDPPIIAAESKTAWRIQVGSFQIRAEAHLTARDARLAAQSALTLQPAVLRPVNFGSAQFWQVQFTGFDEDKARQACVDLLQSGLPCIALPSPQV